MGIPSFYNKLIQTIAGITSFVLSKNPDILAFDANCAIYTIHKKLQDDGVFYDHTKHTQYEDLLISETIKYFQTIIDEVKPTKGVFIALDGVVPFAKILQQRRRRFKSIQIKKDELEIKKTVKPFFDTNCITPGTCFMDKLNTQLKTLSLSSQPSSQAISKPKSIPIFVSTSDEFGEGEQKIMQFIRCNHTLYKSYVIYGLDADLIVLSILHSNKYNINIELVREEIEFNPTGSLTKFVYFNNNQLMNCLYTNYSTKEIDKTRFLNDFVGAMNLLGNDFVPHSYSLKIKDEGIEKLMSLMKTFQITLKSFLMNEDFSYNLDFLSQLFESLSTMEEYSITKKIQYKSTRTPGYFCKTSDPIDLELAIYNDNPLVWKADSIFVDSYSSDGKLKPSFKSLYHQHILYNNQELANKLYLESLAFTINYYIGNDIDNDFYYPFHYSPLFSDIFHYIQTNKVKNLSVPNTKRIELKPIQQLICVLPEDSFYLVPTKYKELIKKYPVYFPKTFDYFSFGKFYMYECEPNIPILHSSIVRKMFELFESEIESIPVPSIKKLR
jgi:5'-3' exoribonuclease 1